MPHYQFMYGDTANQTRIEKWIDDKISATVRKNIGLPRTKEARTTLERMQDLHAREMLMKPDVFEIACREPAAAVGFNLNQTTGEITVEFFGFGEKGGNPWWCLAKPQDADSKTCSPLAVADAPYNISILEYIQRNLLVQTGPTRGTRRRVSVRWPTSSPRSSNSNRSTRSTKRKRMWAKMDSNAANRIGSTNATGYSSNSNSSSRSAKLKRMLDKLERNAYRVGTSDSRTSSSSSRRRKSRNTL